MCVRRTLEVGKRILATLVREGPKAKILAVVRVMKPLVGIGLEFLDTDSDSQGTLLAWIESLRKFPWHTLTRDPSSTIEPSDYLTVTQCGKANAIGRRPADTPLVS